MTELTREEALAAALGEYRREADRHGPYRGYLAEAYELIRRLEEQGYTITPLSSLNCSTTANSSDGRSDKPQSNI
jgi:hypothetical protein